MELKSQGIDDSVFDKSQDELSSLQKTYLLAAKAIRKIRKEGFVSSNYMSRAREGDAPHHYSLEDYYKTKKIIDEQSAKVLSQTGSLRNYFNITLMEARLAKVSHAGNCNEMASFLFLYLCERMDPNIPLEKVGIKGGDHALIVVGRDQNSLLENPATWGEAVIIDPWSYAFFSARNFFEREVAVVGHQYGQPKRRKFDPSTDTLILHTSRFMQSKELRASGIAQLESHTHLLKEMLDNFHQLKVVLDKKVQAGNICTYLTTHSCSNGEKSLLLKDLFCFSLLYDQMNYFTQS